MSQPVPVPQAKSLPQQKEALLKGHHKQLKDDIKAILENFHEIVKLGKIEEETQVNRYTQVEEDALEMQVRAANIVRAGESLMKLVAELKQYQILNDFPSVNESIDRNTKLFKDLQAETDRKLMALRDDIATELYELEEEYYTSMFK
ncbi:unnamed protein product [Notodromas monacha]|uniref:Mediator of RNA polymerase II transcription subunit 22 n=1 Tax=Notodromas monacha TaxID=399045 RepID=A0A7R9BES1_9CRUS|nr:unnamed protein product [Notodromas monacha]CAG0913158.1 unnamed protein product [Notodromas monacha]